MRKRTQVGSVLVLALAFSPALFLFQNCGQGGFTAIDTFEAVSLSQIQSGQNLLQNKALGILSNNCKDCHDTQNLGGLSGILNVDHLIANNLIVPGEPLQSKLYQSVSNNTMPPTYALTMQEKKDLNDWILSLGNKGPDQEPPIPADLSFNMKLSSDPILFKVRLSKLTYVVGSPSSSSLSKLHENRFLLGDYEYVKGVIPKFSLEVNDLHLWLQSIEPVCQSQEVNTRFVWPQGAGPFIELALGRGLSFEDNQVIQQVAAISGTNREKFEVFCLAVLGSMEFLSK